MEPCFRMSVVTSLPGQLYWVPQIAYDAWQGSRSDRTNMTSFQFVGCILQIFLLKRVDCRSGEVNLKSQTIVQLYHTMSIYGGDFVALFDCISGWCSFD